jgi:hypothetical protein
MRAHIAQRVVEHACVETQVHVAGDARNFGSIRLEDHDRGIAGDAEYITPLLRVGQIAIQVHRHEQFGFLDEVRAAEHRRLELLAGRTPLRTPVEQHRLVGRLRRLEGCIHVAVEPRDAGCVGMHAREIMRGRRRWRARREQWAGGNHQQRGDCHRA